MLMNVNIIGRTKHEQNQVERELKAKGSLWPRLDILHRYPFTKEEFEKAETARAIVARFAAKVARLAKAVKVPGY